VTSEARPHADLAEPARRWRNATQAAICDAIEPWAHGSIVRAERYPSYRDFNLVRVEDDPGMNVEALVAVADAALAGLPHRRLDFDLVDVGMALRAEFTALGWHSERIVWMHHGGTLPPGPRTEVEEVPYDAAADLRRAWHHEDHPGQDPSAHQADAREVHLSRGARTLALIEGRSPVAFAQLEHAGSEAEITHVYVHPEHRGGGRGTAVTRAAIEAAGDVSDLWIAADDEDRPKELYARLGFRPAWTSIEFALVP
jgi:ribosomal protein S18 acetylase RimI-like enzyme